MLLNLNKTIFLLTVLIIGTSSLKARCLQEASNLTFFIEARHIHMIQIIAKTTNGYTVKYKAKKIKSYRDQISDTITIYALSIEDGDPHFITNRVYLVELFRNKYSAFEIDDCSYRALQNTKKFRRDSICFESFNNKNTLVNNEYFRGRVIRGKAHGKWFEEGDSGTYKRGKRVGIWTVGTTKLVYTKRGKLYEEYFVNDTVWRYTRSGTWLIYEGVVLRRLKKTPLRRRTVLVYKNKQMSQKIVFYKYGSIKEISCFEDGKCIQKLGFKKDSYSDAELDRIRCNYDPIEYFMYGNCCNNYPTKD